MSITASYHSVICIVSSFITAVVSIQETQKDPESLVHRRGSGQKGWRVTMDLAVSLLFTVLTGRLTLMDCIHLLPLLLGIPSGLANEIQEERGVWRNRK